MNRQLITPRDNRLAQIRYTTLQETVITLRATRGTQSREYRALEGYYGKERLDQIWEQHKAKEAGKGGTS